jgi:hypothetical protein
MASKLSLQVASLRCCQNSNPCLKTVKYWRNPAGIFRAPLKYHEKSNSSESGASDCGNFGGCHWLHRSDFAGLRDGGSGRNGGCGWRRGLCGRPAAGTTSGRDRRVTGTRICVGGGILGMGRRTLELGSGSLGETATRGGEMGGSAVLCARRAACLGAWGLALTGRRCNPPGVEGWRMTWAMH